MEARCPRLLDDDSEESRSFLRNEDQESANEARIGSLFLSASSSRLFSWRRYSAILDGIIDSKYAGLKLKRERNMPILVGGRRLRRPPRASENSDDDGRYLNSDHPARSPGSPVSAAGVLKSRRVFGERDLFSRVTDRGKFRVDLAMDDNTSGECASPRRAELS